MIRDDGILPAPYALRNPEESSAAVRQGMPRGDGMHDRADLNDGVATDGTGLSLRGLLHHLWDQTKLTRWQPGFAGKRSWSTARRHLLHAAENKVARDSALRAKL